MVSPEPAMMMAGLSGWSAACAPGCIVVPLVVPYPPHPTGPVACRFRPGSLAAGMDVTTRFTELIGEPEGRIPLDEGALLIAAHAYPDLDVDAELARLDDLAQRCPASDVGSLVRWLFVDQAFSGNVRAYHDPRNSYLNDVVARRTGIPI